MRDLALFVEDDGNQFQKMVFEVVQVPPDRLGVEVAPRIAHFEVQIGCDNNLKTW